MSTEPKFEWYGGYPVQSETGVDLTLLRANRDRPVESRFAQNTRFFGFVRELGKEANPVSPTDLDPERIVTCLVSEGVDFVLIGGLAMIAHGSAHFTKDADIIYSRSEANIAALIRALDPLKPYLRGAPPGLPFKLDAETIGAGLNFTLTTQAGDILGVASGIGGYEEAMKVAELHEMYGQSIYVLTLEGLIAAKKAARRVKDQLHLLELEELKKIRDEKKLNEGP